MKSNTTDKIKTNLKLDWLNALNGNFVDKYGRIYLFRGVNLSGSSKVPFHPNGATHLEQYESIQNHTNVSFIGRPFPEEQAEEHFSRLRKWGINLLRFLITWEAIEHSGKGTYDEEYLNYVTRLIELAGKKGFYVFIDPHQDVWSRFTGGDGAPGWTLEAVGMDLIKIYQSDSVLLHNVQKEHYKQMSWPLNYYKYPTATMFTLFFGGKVFANKIKIEDQNPQEYLQNAYIQAILQVAKRVKNFKHVLGFDSLNEPSPGWIAHPNLMKFNGIGFGLVNTPSPFQEMCLSEGISLNVQRSLIFGTSKIPISQVRLNSKGISIWKKDFECIWKKQGVWSYDPNGAPILLKPQYFSKVNGRNIEFFRDFLKPFIQKFQTAIQNIQKKFFIFIESDPSKLELEWKEESKKGHAGVVNATHWYNVQLLFMKRFVNWFGIDGFNRKLVFGKKQVEKLHFESIQAIKEMSQKHMLNSPTVIGETGIPMDLNHKQAYKNNNYSKHEQALDMIYSAIEKNFVNVTLWNYTPDNTHEHGDNWNKEDLSIYSLDTPKFVDADGGRGVKAFSRPYPIWTEGEPIFLSFDIQKSLFKYKFGAKDTNGACAIFIPKIHYPNGIEVEISEGKFEYFENENLLIFSGTEKGKFYGITIRPKKQT